ncbi:MAG: hypothetical protein A2452_08685 [Candidatus Firestonebacteria bacterium RIFOXYC2_FULL_39_67]|nr:MAG: hypothetical protein A2536_09825 [Candidatus Firestonebacteria bacterium RIFOXYD2_FULL_39_29]OGF57045.1 MAG: hypothetical protein A2497_09285 [Candidatus Firestonebacteria bacterium RifOxyC12_full_39_7]OGF57188.1 MAG: hypothetical protein A2452_08685 [Candidatus Firestonebacteria bacterium RIFOXYC2_FULL_39_67]
MMKNKILNIVLFFRTINIFLLKQLSRLLVPGCLFAFISAGSLFAVNGAGTSIGTFLNLPAGARASGMGEAFTAISDDATAVYWNPAGMNFISNPSVSLMHSIWFEGMTYDWVSGVFPTSLGTFGAGVQYMNYGSIPETNVDGLELGSYNPADLSFSLSYGTEISGLKIGLTAKYISLRVKNYTTAFAGDFGLITTLNLAGLKTNIGAAIHNFGMQAIFVNEKESLPTTGNIGAAVWIIPEWTVSVETIIPFDNVIGFAAGTEFSVKVADNVNLIGRAGYYSRSNLNNITFGAGVKIDNISVDYAFEPFGDLGDTHRFSFNMQFGK